MCACVRVCVCVLAAVYVHTYVCLDAHCICEHVSVCVLCECVVSKSHTHTHTPSLPQPPTEPNGIITNYTIRYREESTTSTYRTSPLSSNSTHHYIIGLETTSSYLVEVAASTSVGLGPYSEPVAVSTEQPGR